MAYKVKFSDLPKNHPRREAERLRARRSWNYDKFSPAEKRQRTEGLRKSHLKRKFGLSVEDYDEINLSQDGLCAICRRPETARNPHTERPRRLAIDHDHRTGKIRGLLCYNCNSLIGLVHDSIERLKAAIKYLESY